MGGEREAMRYARGKQVAGTCRGQVGNTAVMGAKDRDINQVTARIMPPPVRKPCKPSWPKTRRWHSPRDAAQSEPSYRALRGDRRLRAVRYESGGMPEPDTRSGTLLAGFR